MGGSRSSGTRRRPIRSRCRARSWSASARARSTTSICGNGAGSSASRFRCRTFPAATSPATWSPRRCPTSRPVAASCSSRASAAAGAPPASTGATTSARSYEVLGYQHHAGGYAELVKVPAPNLVPLPDEIDYVQAAAFPLTFLTAWHMLVTRAGVRRGEDVLVLAAGSGVGQAAIQIAALHGARVFATVGSDEKRRPGAGPGGRRGDRPLSAGRRRGSAPPDEPPRGRCRHRTCRPGDLDAQRARAGARRPPGDVRRHHRAGRRPEPAGPVRQAAVDSRDRTWGERASCCGWRASSSPGS